MERFIANQLLAWKNKDDRKPLILRGARQVGKTYAIRSFAATHYDNLAEFNFDRNKELAHLFAVTKDPKRILEQLSMATGQKIEPSKTLLFFDEIQECPDALNSLKYFCEEAPEYHVIAAGSLLGVRLAKTSFPVGKVNFLDLYPMSFSEFLIADGYQHLVDYMRGLEKIEEIPELFSSQLEEKLKAYFLVGGMPEAVATWVAKKDIAKVREVQSEILDAYEADFSKHVSTAESNKISLIWNGVISQLAKENKKFIYQALKQGARAREYEDALNWLRDAGLIEKILNVSKPSLPLATYEDLSAFKIYLLDVGLLTNMSGIGSDLVLGKDRLFTEAKGAFAENYVLQTLRASGEKHINYFTFDRYELDFLLQKSGKVFPVEVKSGKRSTHKSLTNYIEKNQPNLALRFSTNNLAKDGAILNIPLYLAEYTNRLIELAEAQ